MRRSRPDRDTTIDAATRAGKIRGADADRYRQMWDADPVSIRRLLTARVEQGGLMPGIVAAEESVAEGYDPAWLSPAERSTLAATQAAPSPPPAAPVPTAATAATDEPRDEYDDGWLSGEERDRISAAKEGQLKEGPVQFEDDAARQAATTGANR